MFTRIVLLSVAVALYNCNSPESAAESDGKKVQAVLCTPKTTDIDWYSSGKKAPLFEGLGGIDFRITTSSSEAQRYFNQGMMLSYGFNHAEAARSFFEATRIDSTCAMCHWGFAYVLGPNYNAGMEPDNFQRAYEAVIKAERLSGSSPPLERDLIQALTKRYAKEPPENRGPLDIAYSEAMKSVYAKYPDHPDVAALYAESLMDLHPWDLWLKDGTPQPWTPELLATLESVMRKNPQHPGAHHFYIHAVEAGPNPEKALPSAKLLETMVPGAAHLVHMPSHIYINTGDYHDGSLANLRAVKQDSAYVDACHAQGAYPLAYYPHNWHFLAATATLAGEGELAMRAAYKVQELTDTAIMKEPGWSTLQHYYTIPYNVAIKLGRWDEILAMPSADPSLKYIEAVRRYARGMAWAGNGDLDKALSELRTLKELAADSSLTGLTIWGFNSMTSLLDIAERVLMGHILFKKHEYDESIRLLTEAAELEDQLVYQEPPDWFFSVRHHLGWMLLEAGNVEEAIATYREDLVTWPENGWALHGLYLALEKHGRAKEAAEVKKQFEEAWKWADVELTGSVVM